MKETELRHKKLEATLFIVASEFALHGKTREGKEHNPLETFPRKMMILVAVVEFLLLPIVLTYCM